MSQKCIFWVNIQHYETEWFPFLIYARRLAYILILSQNVTNNNK